MPLNSGILQQIAAGGQSLVPQMMAKGARLGQQLKLAQQADQDRAANQAISQALATGGLDAAINAGAGSSNLQQLAQLVGAQNSQQQRDEDQAFRQQRAQQQDAFNQQQFAASEAHRANTLGLQRDALSQRRELAQQKRAEKAAAKKRGGKPTVDSAKAAGFFDRLQAAEEVLSDPKSVSAAMDRTNIAREGIASATPFRIGGESIPKEFQKFDQARRDFVNAVLRRESGAVISDTEFANAAQQYFPVPGNGPEVIAQKAQNRRIAIEGIRRAGLPSLGEETTQTPNRRRKFNPATGALE